MVCYNDFWGDLATNGHVWKSGGHCSWPSYGSFTATALDGHVARLSGQWQIKGHNILHAIAISGAIELRRAIVGIRVAIAFGLQRQRIVDTWSKGVYMGQPVVSTKRLTPPRDCRHVGLPTLSR